MAAAELAKQVNQYAGAPPAPAAPPATVAGVGLKAAKQQDARHAAVQSVRKNMLAGATPAAGAPATTPAAAIASAPAAPAAPAASPATSPAAPLTTPTALLTTPAASSWVGDPSKDPRDATYYANIAKSRSDANIQETNLDLEQTQHQGAHDTAALQIAHQNDLNTRAQRENNARSGLGTSTQGGNAIGEVEWNFAQANAANETDLKNWIDAANISRLAIEQGYTVEEASQLAQATYRKAQMDALLPPAAAAAKTPNASTTASAAHGPLAAPKPGVATAQSGPPPDEHHWWDGTKWIETGPNPGDGSVWDGTRWVQPKPHTTIVPGPSAPVPTQYSQPNNPATFAPGPNPGDGSVWNGSAWVKPAAATAAAGQPSAAQKEWWRKRNEIASRHGEGSAEVRNYEKRSPMPR